MAKYSRVELRFFDHSRYCFEFVDADCVRALEQWAKGFDDDVMEFRDHGKTYWFHRQALAVLTVEPEWIPFEWVKHVADTVLGLFGGWVLKKTGVAK